MMASIPEEIFVEILLRLPVKSTLVCKCVCRNWYALISNPSFVKMHHNLAVRKSKFNFMISKFDRKKSRKVIYSVNFDPLSLSSNEFHLYGMEIDRPLECLDFDIQFLGSCNGLVCIFTYEKESFGLWNPDSNEYKELAKSPNKPMDQPFFPYAFGYDYNTGDYKVICLYENYNLNGCLVDVYTMGPNSWKSTQVVPYMFMQEESGVVVNGVFHWFGQRIDEFSDVVISLDISNERFKELQPPPEEPSERGEFPSSLGVLKEYLCVFYYGVDVEVWVMQDYGVQESWTRHYIVTHQRIVDNCILRPMWSFSGSGEILLVSGSFTHTDMVLYDPKDGSARKPNMHVDNQIFTFPILGNAIILKA